MNRTRSTLPTLALSFASLLSLAALLGACQPPGIDDEGVDTGLVDDTTGDGDGEPPGDGDGDPTGDGDGEPPGCAAELDILLVLDNSGSMGANQRRFVDGISGLIGPLDAAGVDWRLGVTTSDNGNAWCPAGQTTPEGGKLVLSSCRNRLNDFLLGDNVDVQDELCRDICELDDVETIPTVTTRDPKAEPRPWIERIGGQTNLADGVTVEQALPCVLPMGVNGCGFESQLDSAYFALARADSPNEASYGFLRESASLLVLVLSDEADCSNNKDWSEIFDDQGNKVFWSDPAASFPTSAVCWNAGVECIGDPSNYTSCVAQNYDVNGNPGVDDAAAVLYPVSRYVGLLQGLEDAKKALDPNATVQFALIGGVETDGSITYADTLTDPGFQDSFGIGPGCEGAADISAVPPVRMREVTETIGGKMGSICATEFGSVLTEVVTPFVGSCG